MIARAVPKKLAIAALVAGIAFFVCLTPVGGGDTWWYLATGRFIEATGRVPMTDPFSYTAPGVPWINPEWLTNLIFFLSARAWGFEALFALKVATVAATLLLLFRRMRRRCSGDAEALLGVALVAIGISAFLDIRAQLFTFLLTLLTLELADAPLPLAAKASLMTILTALWANLHGGFALAFPLLGLQFPAFFLSRTSSEITGTRPATTATLLLAAFAGSLLTPYGLRIYENSLSYIRLLAGILSGSEILAIPQTLEWISPLQTDIPGFLSPAFWVVLPLLAVLLVRGRERFRASDVLLAAVTGALALTSRRFIPLFFLTTGDLFAGIPASVPDRVRRNLAVAALACALAFLGVTKAPDLFAARSHGFFSHTTAEATFPARACAFLRERGLSGRILNRYNWGGFLTWNLFPPSTVFVDGRAHTVYPPEILLERDAAAEGQDWEDICRRRGVEIMVLSPWFQKRLVTLANASGAWRIVFEDDVSVVLVRNDAAAPQERRR